MSRLTITIDMDNAAFDEPGEAARILRKLASDMGEYNAVAYRDWVLFDVNGNTVGKVEVSGD